MFVLMKINSHLAILYQLHCFLYFFCLITVPAFWPRFFFIFSSFFFYLDPIRIRNADPELKTLMILTNRVKSIKYVPGTVPYLAEYQVPVLERPDYVAGCCYHLQVYNISLIR
jgi:hypothetical protein